jgi:hypothetical protein
MRPCFPFALFIFHCDDFDLPDLSILYDPDDYAIHTCIYITFSVRGTMIISVGDCVIVKNNSTYYSKADPTQRHWQTKLNL